MNLMVEDSKTWFEIYEVAIAVYEENDKYLNKIENNNNEDTAWRTTATTSSTARW